MQVLIPECGDRARTGSGPPITWASPSQSLSGRIFLAALTLALLALTGLSSPALAQQGPTEPVGGARGPSVELGGAEMMLQIGEPVPMTVRISGLDESRRYYVAAIRTGDSIGRGSSCSAHWGHTDLTGRDSAELELEIWGCKSGADGILVLLKEIQESGYGIEVAVASSRITVAATAN